jgi:molecular chaperone DnaJ
VVVVHVEPHRFFTRDKNDLYFTLDVSFAQAVLGDSIEIPTPFGPRILELPRGAKSGQSFVFPGLGVPATGNCHPGKLIITIRISNTGRIDDSDLLNAILQPRKEST